MKGRWPSKVGDLGLILLTSSICCHYLDVSVLAKILQNERFSNTIVPKLFKVKEVHKFLELCYLVRNVTSYQYCLLRYHDKSLAII